MNDKFIMALTFLSAAACVGCATTTPAGFASALLDSLDSVICNTLDMSVDIAIVTVVTGVVVELDDSSCWISCST